MWASFVYMNSGCKLALIHETHLNLSEPLQTVNFCSAHVRGWHHFCSAHLHYTKNWYIMFKREEVHPRGWHHFCSAHLHLPVWSSMDSTKGRA